MRNFLRSGSTTADRLMDDGMHNPQPASPLSSVYRLGLLSALCHDFSSHSIVLVSFDWSTATRVY